jgi:hypothetical protein
VIGQPLGAQVGQHPRDRLGVRRGEDPQRVAAAPQTAVGPLTSRRADRRGQIRSGSDRSGCRRADRSGRRRRPSRPICTRAGAPSAGVSRGRVLVETGAGCGSPGAGGSFGACGAIMAGRPSEGFEESSSRCLSTLDVEVVARAGHVKSSRRCRMYSSTDCAGRPVRSSTSWVKRLYRSSRCSLAMVEMCCWVCWSRPAGVRCSSHSGPFPIL